MPTEFHLRVQEVLDRAARLTGSRQTTFVRQACGRNTRLLREVRSLLPHYELMQDFAPQQPVPAPGATTFARVETEMADAAGEDADPPLPFSIDQYRVTETLGRGGMGVVYRAVARAGSRKPVAIKLLKRALLTPESRQRFELEAHLARQLRHSGIARVLHTGVAEIRRMVGDSIVVEPRPYYVMEHIEGQTLGVYAGLAGLDLIGKLRLWAEICDAVRYAHDRGVIHRDLKPENIIVDADGRPRLLDFGIARHLEFEPTLARDQDGQFIGTPQYASPEQLAGRIETLTPRTDVYSLGVVGWELLTGRLPEWRRGRLVIDPAAVLGTSTETRKTPARNAGRTAAQDELAFYLGRLFETAMARKEEDRYANAGALHDAIEEILGWLAAPSRWQSLRDKLARAFGRGQAPAADHLSRPLRTLLRHRLAKAIDADRIRGRPERGPG